MRNAPSAPKRDPKQPQRGGRTTTASIAPDGSPEGIAAELLTYDDVAALTNMGVRTIHRHSRSGLRPAPLRIGLGSRPAIRFRKSEILAWIENGCGPIRTTKKAAG